MEVWFTEKQTKDLSLGLRVTKTIAREKTPYQELSVLETAQFGRMLTLDGAVQTTIADEFIYHEMITHVPLFAHPDPRRVCIIGGGDGGALREVLRHSRVEEATLVEIDERVLAAARAYLPEISCALDDGRARVIVGDGIAHVHDNPARYDVIIVDSTDPVGAAEGLFTEAFYRDVHRALREDGIVVAQSESPFVSEGLVGRTFERVQKAFSIAKLYLAPIPTYPSGLWSFTAGSKTHDPARPATLASAVGAGTGRLPFRTRYYTPAVHRAAFALPPFVQEIIGQAGSGSRAGQTED